MGSVPLSVVVDAALYRKPILVFRSQATSHPMTLDVQSLLYANSLYYIHGKTSIVKKEVLSRILTYAILNIVSGDRCFVED